jgi:hypothetical protein
MARRIGAEVGLEAVCGGWKVKERVWNGDSIGHATVLYSLEGKRIRMIGIADL